LPPGLGDTWRMNMFRMDVPQGKPQQAVGWSPPLVGDFHALDRFGDLVFGDEKGNLSAVAAPVPAVPAAGEGKAAKGDGKKEDKKEDKKAARARRKAEKAEQGAAQKAAP
ncbi:MAG: hypothetical protein ABUS79_10240, partial [Pseudomonadota bacterium]